MPALALRVFWFVMRSLGLAFLVSTAITDAGHALLESVHGFWEEVFDIPLAGSESTVGDWLVLSGTAYFLTIVIAALALKAVIKGSQVAMTWINPLGGP